MRMQINKGIQWISRNQDDSMQTLEAIQIVEGALIGRGIIKSSTIVERIKTCTKSMTISNCVPSKYGGNICSIIATSKAANTFYGEEEGEYYLDWVVNQQMSDGFWTETITDFLPSNKLWYFNADRRYWVTASVLQNIIMYKDFCAFNIDMAINALSNLITDVIKKTHNQDCQYTSSYLQFMNLDLWTLAHIVRALYMCGMVDKSIMNPLFEIFDVLKKYVLASNPDVMQNVCGVLLDYSPTRIAYINELLDRIIKLQHDDGSWGYNKTNSDITLTAYIIELLLWAR